MNRLSMILANLLYKVKLDFSIIGYIKFMYIKLMYQKEFPELKEMKYTKDCGFAVAIINDKPKFLEKLYHSKLFLLPFTLMFLLSIGYTLSSGRNAILLFICYAISIFYLIFGAIGMFLYLKIRNNAIKIICYIGWAIIICLFFKLILFKYI